MAGRRWIAHLNGQQHGRALVTWPTRESATTGPPCLIVPTTRTHRLMASEPPLPHNRV
jgi:hypothetical protein